MTGSAQDVAEEEIGGANRRFGVQLFIVHPTLAPDEITAGIGIEPHIVHPVGARRRAPNGTELPGRYRDTRWRHRRQFETTDQWFAARVTELADQLLPRKAFLRELRSSGGRACINVVFLGDGHFGDEIPVSTLVKLMDLNLNLAIEVYDVPQSTSFPSQPG